MKQYKYKWLVSVPGSKSLITALTEACKHNDKLGSLLEYFHYNATIEASKQGLEIGIQEITISRTLDNIISGLNNSGKKASKKTVIQWIVNLQSLNYIRADGPHHKYTICLQNIQAGINTPPEAEKPKLRGIHASRAALEASSEDIEHCNFTMLPKTTMSDEDIVKLQRDIVNLQCTIVELQCTIVNLQCAESSQAARIAALEGKIESLLSITIDNTIITTKERETTAIAALPSFLPDKQIDSTSKKPATKKPASQKEDKPPFDSIHENNFWRLWCECWINKYVTPKVTDTARQHVKVIAPLIQTEEALNRLIEITVNDMRSKKHTGKPALGNLRGSLAEWEKESYSQPQEDKPATPPQEDENRLVVWSRYGITKQTEARENWFMFELMAVWEAKQYGFQGREFVSTTRKEIANELTFSTPEEIETLRAKYLSKQAALVSA